MWQRIAMKDFLCRIGLEKPDFLMACLFLKPLDGGQRSQMERHGWVVKDLPRNPYHPAA